MLLVSLNILLISTFFYASLSGKNVRETFYRTRQRFILKHPLNSGTHCPTQLDKEPCLIPEHCFEYEWLESNWGMCMPVSEQNGMPKENSNGQQCGRGLKTRGRFYPKKFKGGICHGYHLAIMYGG